MDALQTELERLTAKRQELAQMFDAAGPDMNFTSEQVDEVKSRNAELDGITTKVEVLREAKDIQTRNHEALRVLGQTTRDLPLGNGKSDMGGTHQLLETKSIGQVFVESKAYQSFRANREEGRSPSFSFETDYNVKTLMSEAAGFTPQAIRTGVVVPSAQQMPKIVDIVPASTTDMTAVVYMLETTFTNAAAETAEGAAYAEAALAYTEENSPVRKIAVILPVTDEQLADVPGMQDRINNRLTLMMRQRVDLQLLTGNGSAPNLQGFNTTSGIQTYALNAEPAPDAIHRGITKIQTIGFADPNYVIMNPNDWETIRLLKTADGLYIYGPPSDLVTPRLWGLPVVTSTYQTAHTALVGDFGGYTELDFKANLEFEVSNSHTDYFGKGILAIRAQLRAALVVYRPTALCTVTGI